MIRPVPKIGKLERPIKSMELPAPLENAALPEGVGYTDPMPPGGWPLRLAVFTLVSSKWKNVANVAYDLQQKEPKLHSEGWQVSKAFNVFWLDLVERLNSGEIKMRGRFSDQTQIEDIDPGLLRGSFPSYRDDAVAAKGGLFIYNVTLFERPAQLSAGSAGRRTGPPTNKTAGATVQMLDEMNRGVITPQALRDMLGKELTGRYDLGRTACVKARADALSQFNSDK